MKLPGFGKLYRTLVLIIFRFLRKNRSREIQPNFNKILITFSKGAGLGNILLAFPFIEALHEKLPPSKLTLLCHENNIPEKLGLTKYVDRILHVDKALLAFSTIKMILDIRKWQYDLVINPEFYGTTIFIYSLIAFGNFSYRLGHVGEQVQNWAKNWCFLYNLKVDISVQSHEAKYYQKILENLGIEYRQDKSKPHIPFTDEKMFVEGSEYQMLASRPYVCLAPGSNPNQAWKRWPYTKYAKLARYIKENSSYEVVLLGTTADCDCADKITEMNNGKIINLCGKTTIHQVISLLKSAKILVTNDSGLMHLANALNRPVIALYGPTDKERTFPLGHNNIIITNKFECSPCYNPKNKTKIGHYCKGRIDCLNSLHVIDVWVKLYKSLEPTSSLS